MEQYTVVTSIMLASLVKIVNGLTRIGYKPIGGVFKDDGIFYQAMLLDSKSDCCKERTDEELLRDVELL